MIEQPDKALGGSWGSITAALFASGPGRDALAALILYAPIYAERNAGWLDFLADPQKSTQINPAFMATRLVDEAGTRARWDAEIPPGAHWRSEDVFQALVQSSLSDDTSAADRSPPAFQAPNGTLLDLWEAFNARPLYDPANITCPTLLIRGGADQTSTRTDALALFDRVSSPHKRYLEIANAAHFGSVERHGPEFFASTIAFLQEWRGEK